MGTFHQISPITGHLFLSGYPALKPDRILHCGVTNIINCSMDIPCPTIGKISYTRVAVTDMPRSNLAPYFDKCADYINQVKSKGGKTLVHCMAGVSRSASICIVYLMKYYKMTLADAYKYVRIRRAVIRPNYGFFKQMIDYETRLFGKASVKMINSPIGIIPDVYQQDLQGMIWLTHQEQANNERRLQRHTPAHHTASFRQAQLPPMSNSTNTISAMGTSTGSVYTANRGISPTRVIHSSSPTKHTNSSNTMYTAKQLMSSSPNRNTSNTTTRQNKQLSSSADNYKRQLSSSADNYKKQLSSSADNYKRPAYKYDTPHSSMFRSEPNMSTKQIPQAMTTYQLSYGGNRSF